MSKIKAIVSLGDALAQLTGRQIKKLAEKLGLDPKRNLSENQLRTAVADEGQKFIKQKNKDSDRLVGGAALTAGASAAYSAGDFIRDMLGIKTMGDSTLKQTAKADVPETPKSKPKIPEKPQSKPKTKSQEELKKSVKKAVNANKGKLITNKKRFGHTDYRKGGMVY